MVNYSIPWLCGQGMSIFIGIYRCRLHALFKRVVSACPVIWIRESYWTSDSSNQMHSTGKIKCLRFSRVDQFKIFKRSTYSMSPRLWQIARARCDGLLWNCSSARMSITRCGNHTWAAHSIIGRTNAYNLYRVEKASWFVGPDIV